MQKKMVFGMYTSMILMYLKSRLEKNRAEVNIVTNICLEKITDMVHISFQ